MKFTLPRQALQSNETEEIFGLLRLVRAESNTVTGAVILKAWRGKAAQPFAHYRFPDEIRREVYAEELKRNEAARAARAEAERKERAEFKHSLVVGDILDAVWGYDQTNANFYQVTEVRGKVVILREVVAPLVAGEESFMSGRRMPKKDEFKGEPMRRLVTRGNSVRISSCQSASKWNGQPVSVSWYA